MKKGFTLVELIVVIAIISIAATLIGTQFFGLLGNGGKTDQFEKEVIAKGIADAAYVYIDSKDNKKLQNDAPNKVIVGKCHSASILIETGYISSKQGLLTECSYDKDNTDSCLNKFYFKVTKDYGEKKVSVYEDNLCNTIINY